MFQARVGKSTTRVFAAEFNTPEEGAQFLRRIKDDLANRCQGTRTDFWEFKNVRSRRISRNMRTYHKPKRMTAMTILNMQGIPQKWKQAPRRKGRSRRSR